MCVLCHPEQEDNIKNLSRFQDPHQAFLLKEDMIVIPQLMMRRSTSLESMDLHLVSAHLRA